MRDRCSKMVNAMYLWKRIINIIIYHYPLYLQPQSVFKAYISIWIFGLAPVIICQQKKYHCKKKNSFVPLNNWILELIAQPVISLRNLTFKYSQNIRINAAHRTIQFTLKKISFLNLMIFFCIRVKIVGGSWMLFTQIPIEMSILFKWKLTRHKEQEHEFTSHSVAHQTSNHFGHLKIHLFGIVSFWNHQKVYT